MILEVNELKNVHIPLSEKTMNFPPFPPLNPLLTPLRGSLELKLSFFDIGYILTFISKSF